MCLSSLHLQATRECTVRGGSVLAEELQQGRSADSKSRDSVAAKGEADGGGISGVTPPNISHHTHSSVSSEMASPDPGRDVPNGSERSEPSHPEPACQEAQKWIEVSGRVLLGG